MKIIKNPIIGEASIREAIASDFDTIIQLVRAAVASALYPGQRDRYVSISAIYPDYVVVKNDGRQFKFPYTVNSDNKIVLDSPEEVVTKFESVREALSSDEGVFIEAIKSSEENKGNRWLVRVVKAGVSGNKNYYSNALLRESASLFNNVRVFVKGDIEHLKGGGKDFNKLIGRLVESKFIENKGVDNGEIQAVFEVLESAGDIAEKLRECKQRDMTDLFGFSIDANAKVKMTTINGQRVREAKKLTKVHSLDLIIEPGAGGEIVQLLEAQQSENITEDDDMKLRERMLEAIRKANKGKLPESLDETNDEQIEAAFREAVASTASNDNTGGEAAVDNGLSEEKVTEAINNATRLVEARAEMRVSVAESKLPEASKKRLRNNLENVEELTTEKVTEAIKAEREYLASLTESGSVMNLGGESIEAGQDRSEKVSEMFDGLFDPKNKDVISIKECYIEVTGDKRVTGQIRDCDMSIMRESFCNVREAISAATFSSVLGDSITRRMLADYNVQNMYDVWRNIATVVPVSDFRTQERTRMGGYGDLPDVSENDAYASLTSPTDEKATYAVSKRGGTETISLETIKNDDMSVVQRIPMKLSRAAKRTLAKFVLDFIKTNPAIYDGDALFHANHNNLGSSALGAASLAAGRLAMLQQTELDSGDRLGIPAKNLLVPTDLEETAYDLFRRTTNNDTDFVESLQMNVLPIWYWTDANDWAITADKDDIPLIEIGFLDGNEEPELFVQDTPNQGSLFSNDQIIYKIRHVYNGAPQDFRGFYKSVVA